MSTMAAPVSLRACIVSRICAWTVTSRAVVGSSAMITSGSLAMAMAITARCRMPPENSCGYARRAPAGWGCRRGEEVDRTDAGRLRTAGCGCGPPRPAAPRSCTPGSATSSGPGRSWPAVAAHVQHLGVVRVGQGALAAPSSRKTISPPTISPGGSSMRRMMVSAVTLLPGPTPHHAERLAGLEVERHVVDGGQRAGSGGEHRAQVSNREHRIGHVYGQSLSLGSAASRRALPTSVMAISVIAIIIDGAITSMGLSVR